MAKPMATDKELNRLRKEGMEVTAENLRKVRAEIRAEEIAKSEARNRKGKKAGPTVTEPAGRYAKGGMVTKANCGASMKPTQKYKQKKK